MGIIKNNFGGSLPIFVKEGKGVSLLGELNKPNWEINDLAIYDFLLYTSFLPENSPVKGVGMLGAGMDISGNSDYKTIDTKDLRCSRNEVVLGIKPRLERKHKFDLLDSKKVLKGAFADSLLPEILHQPKRGWFSPGAKWIRRKAMKELVFDVLNPSYYDETREFFDWGYIQKSLDIHLSKKANFGPVL